MLALSATIGLGGCNGVQSALTPEGPEAERVWLLFWIMTAGGIAILALVVVLTAIAIAKRPAWLGSEVFIIAGGLIFPAVTLTVLLAYGFALMSSTAGSSDTDASLRLSIRGEQWWWRVTYLGSDGRNVESANEIRIPVGRKVRMELTSADVIHSLWIPKLAGKLDMIPGRTTVLNVEAKTAGVSRGQCAEYCGGAHAMMAFYVVALPEDEFAAWLEKEKQPATSALDQGQMLFQSSGCGSCHTIRGTTAVGTIGPDLTHLGSRMSLGAGVLPNDEQSIARWIADNQHIKPKNRMPPFGIFLQSELSALSSYLAGLK